MARRRDPSPPPTEELPTEPAVLLDTPAPTGALPVTPVSPSSAPEPAASPFAAGGTSLRSALPELDEVTESAGASGRSWGSPPSLGQQPPGTFVGARRTGSVPKVQSLEELYAMVPDLAQMGARLRVERTTPEWVSTPEGKVATSGVLGYLTDTPSTEEFARRFGGRTYSVYAMVDAAPKGNAGGPPMEMCKGVAELRIPLDPNLDNLPIVGSQDDQEFDMNRAYRVFHPNQNGQTFVVPMQGQQQQPPPQQPQDVSPLLNFAGDMVRTFARPGQSTPSADPTIVTQMADRQTQILQDQLRKMEEQNRILQERLEQQSSKPSAEVAVLQSMSGVLSAMKGSATGEETESLRRQHEREIERMNAQHEADRSRLVQEHVATLNRLEKDHQIALDRLEKDRINDVDRLRRDIDSERQRFAEKERDLRDAHEKEVRFAREESERRLRDRDESAEKRERDLRHTHEQEVARIKEMYDSRLREQERAFASQLDSHKMHSDTLKTTVETTAGVQIENLRNEVAKLTAQLGTAEARARQLEQENRPKPFLEQLGEVTQTAQAVGFVKPGEAGGEKDEGEGLSANERIVQTLVEGAAQRLPEIIQATGVGPLIGSVANRLGGGGAAGQEQPRHVNVTQVNQAPQLPPQRLVFAEADAPVDIPQGPLGDPQPPPVPMEQPQQQQPQQQAAPRQRQQRQQQPPQQAAPAQPPPNPWAGFEWTGLGDDTLTTVFGTIMKGMQEDAAPAAVVEQLSAQFGPEVVAAIPAAASVDRVIASIRKAPVAARSPLASPQGRAYIRDVWAAMKPASKPTQEAAS